MNPREPNFAGSAPPRILVVDDDAAVCAELQRHLAARGRSADVQPDVLLAIDMLRCEQHESGICRVVLADAGMQGGGAEFLSSLARERVHAAVVLLAEYGSVESAVEALRLGACDYLVRPVVDAELDGALARADARALLLMENSGLRRRAGGRPDETILGTDPRMLRVFEFIDAVAPTRTTVLMCGESGTGKSLVARAIHDRSPRRGKPFIELACGSIPETLLESELFGHVKGAFTGAHTDAPGRFRAADGGTIFLDEINSASPAMQLKLLRVLQERRFEPVGSTQTCEVDVRIVLASNQPLEALVTQGIFRQDLYYRINVVKIDLPPLRSRAADIPLLAARFLDRFAAEQGKQLVGFTPRAMDLLRAYPYPGNVRELQNIVERAAVLARRPTIDLDELPDHIRGTPGAGVHESQSSEPPAQDEPWRPIPLEQALLGSERQILLRALSANGWNRSRTAEQLGINRTTLYKKMKQHGLLDGGGRAAG